MRPDASTLKLNLREGGLTEYETAAYAALVSKNQRTAEEIAAEAGIPITRVYDILEQLVLKGFAVSAPGRPKHYRATPPERAVSDYLAFLKRSFESNMEQVRTALKQAQQTVAPIYWESHMEVKPDQLIEPIDDLKEMESVTRSNLQRARNEILISTALFTWLPRVKREILAALNRGARVRILMHSPSPEIKTHLRAVERAGGRVRQSRDEWYPVRGTLVDDTDLVLVIWASEEPERFWYPKVYQPQKTKNPGVVRLFRESFEYRWSHSRPVKGA